MLVFSMVGILFVFFAAIYLSCTGIGSLPEWTGHWCVGGGLVVFWLGYRGAVSARPASMATS